MAAPSPYLRHLPEIFRAVSAEDEPFAGRFLKIFEALLSGRDDSFIGGERVVGLDEKIAAFVEHLDPSLTPVDDNSAVSELESEFLSYLAGWVALALDENWDLGKRRDWLRTIVSLYKRRGTKAGLTEYLHTFVGNQVSVDEPAGGFVVASSSTVAEDTFIAGAPEYFFRVRIAYAFGAVAFDIDEWKNLLSGSKAIVDLEKPAHTYYTLDARTPGFIVANRSTIASDSLIWEKSQPFS